MDQKDLAILNLLMENGRLSYEKISRKVDLTPNAVKNRMNKLMEIGVIKKFTAQLLPKLFNKSICYSVAYLTDDINKVDLVKKLGEREEVVGGYVAIDNKIAIVHLFSDEVELHENFKKYKENNKEILNMDNFILLMPYNADFSNLKITKNDWRIIKVLKDNCRKTDGEVAEELKISTKTVRRRLKYLKNNGIIYFMIDIDTSSGNLLTYNPIIKFKEINSKILMDVKKILKNVFYIWRIANQEALIFTVYISHLREIDQQIEMIKDQQKENIVDIIKLVPTNMYFFENLIDKIIEERAT